MTPIGGGKAVNRSEDGCHDEEIYMYLIDLSGIDDIA